MSNGLIGSTLGKYTIQSLLGEGGMAAVYLARDGRLDRSVAVKVLLPFHQSREVFLKRFDREARALAKLMHPNIVQVIDYGEQDGLPYLVMPYLSGGTLKQQAGKTLGYREAARLLLPVAQALAYAHQHGILHRDVKPNNILLTESGSPMLSDFGIARIYEAEETTQLTGTGAGVGTPEYMAPEQWAGKFLPQTDIYALGVVFYELVSGRRPYMANTPPEVMYKQMTEAIPHPRLYVPGLPARVEKVILKALAKNPADRYESMADFAAALESLAYEQVEQSRSRTVRPQPDEAGSAEAPARRSLRLPWPVLALGLVGLAALAVGAALLLGGGREASLSGTPTPAAALIGKLPADPSTPPAEPTAVEQPAPTAVKMQPSATNTRIPATSTHAPTPTPAWAQVSAGTLNGVILREQASLDAPLVDSAVNGTLVEVLPEAVNADGIEWVRVRLADGQTGWVHGDLLSPAGSPPVGSPTPTGAPISSAAIAPEAVEQLEVLQRWQGHASLINDIAFSPDGALFATASDDGSVIAWRSADRSQAYILTGHTRGASSVDFSPDGKTIATASWGGRLASWDAATGALIQTCDLGKEWLHVQFYQAGDAVAAVAQDSTPYRVTLADCKAEAGESIAAWLTRYKREVQYRLLRDEQTWEYTRNGSSWYEYQSPDESLLARSYEEKTDCRRGEYDCDTQLAKVQVRQAGSQDPLANITVASKTASSGTRVVDTPTGMVFSADNHFLVIYTTNSLVVWPYELEDRVKKFQLGVAKILTAAVSPDSGLIVAADYNGNISVIGLPEH